MNDSNFKYFQFDDFNLFVCEVKKVISTERGKGKGLTSQRLEEQEN